MLVSTKAPRPPLKVEIITSALWRERQKDRCEFEVSLVYIVSSRPVALFSKTLSQTNNNGGPSVTVKGKLKSTLDWRAGSGQWLKAHTVLAEDTGLIPSAHRAADNRL